MTRPWRKAWSGLIDGQMMKCCVKCTTVKPISNFPADKKSVGGHRNQCDACFAERMRLYRASRFEELRAYDSQRHQKLATQERAHKKLYRQTEAAKHLNRMAQAKRRVQKRGIEALLTAEQFEAICVAQHGRCAKCGKKRKLTIDHVIPLSKGGTHTADNVQGLCRHCNATKFTKDGDYRKALLLPLWREGKIIP